MGTHISQLVSKAIEPSGNVGLAYQTETEKFTTKELAVIRAAQVAPNNPRIREMSAQAIEALANRIRKEAVMRLGIAIAKNAEEKETLSYLGKAIAKHPALTEREIIYAVDRALDGWYLKDGQQFVHFSIANFSLWIKAYIEETKTPVMQKAARAKQDEKVEAPAPSEEEQKAMTVKLVNQFLDQRKKDPEHRVTAGVSSLYEDLVRFEIYQPSEEEKAEVVREIRRRRPNLDREGIIREAKGRLYNSFIDSLLMFETRLSTDGKPEPDENPAES